MKWNRSLGSVVALVAIVVAGAGLRSARAEGEAMSHDQESHSLNPNPGLRSGRSLHPAGSWTVDIKPTPGTGLPPEVKALVTFDASGGVVETTILPPVTPAHGTWASTGPREFVFVVVHHLVDPAGNFVGTVKARAHATFINRDQFHAVYEGSLFDPLGNVIAPVSGTEVGARITLLSF